MVGFAPPLALYFKDRDGVVRDAFASLNGFSARHLTATATRSSASAAATRSEYTDWSRKNTSRGRRTLIQISHSKSATKTETE